MEHDGIVNQLLKETEYIEFRPRTLTELTEC